MPSEKLKLKSNHTWKCSPGHSLCVLERGLVRFEYPSGWIVEPKDGAVHLHDRPPSVESCDLGVSIFPVPRELVQAMPLDDTLRSALDSDRKPYQQSEVRHITDAEKEIAWLEERYIDAEHQRDARFRVALVRGPIFCLISMNYWANRAAGLERVWDGVLRTWQFGTPVSDPTKGPLVQ